MISMTYFPDLSQYNYNKMSEPDVLNVGWLDAREPYKSGASPPEFHDALATLCRSPIMLHRGFHVCQFCSSAVKTADWYSAARGNGQIRVRDENGQVFAAPTLIHHYVVVHRYRPPDEFIQAVISAVRASSS
ncbi:MAG TPA: hypothetical protein VG056_07975 [Pirellulales bacterium]|jgi:hypothetical protein|nr:hypothetical protein [Pirellulales bacterium]